MLRITILCYFTYRLVRFWGNTPGQCFRLSKVPNDIPNDQAGLLVLVTFRFLLDAWIGIGTLVYINNANLRDRMDATDENIKALNAQDRTKRPLGILILLIRTARGADLLLANSVFGIQIVLANRTQIVGDENSFDFGQVTALVILVSSFYKIGDSLHSKPCVPSFGSLK